MNSDDLKFTAFRPFPHAEAEEVQRTRPILQRLQDRGAGIPTPILWDLLHSGSASSTRCGERHSEIESSDAWHLWLKSQWGPLMKVSFGNSGNRRLPFEPVLQLAQRIKAVKGKKSGQVPDRIMRTWSWPGGSALRSIVERCEDPMETLGLAGVLEHASGVLRADPFLLRPIGAPQRDAGTKTPPGQRSDASAMTDTISSLGEFARRDPSRLPDDPSRLAPMEHLYMDAVPDYFWQRAAENALVQRFHRRPQDADRRMRSEIVVAIHDDILLHRFEPGNRPPINAYRHALALTICAVQKFVHAGTAEVDLCVEYLGPISKTPITARITAEVGAELKSGDSRIALIHLGRLIPSLVSHHPTPHAARRTALRQPATEYDRRARLQFGPAAERASKEFDEDEVVECVRDSRGRWRVGVPGCSTEAHGLDLEVASDLAASRVLGIVGETNRRHQPRAIDWKLS